MNIEQNRDASNLRCSQLLPLTASTKITPHLPRIQTPSDMSSLKNFLTSRDNNAPIWLDGKRNSPSGKTFYFVLSTFIKILSGQLTWGDNSKVNLDIQAESFSMQCLIFYYTFKTINKVFTLDYNISSADCASSFTYVCEHDSK